MPLSPYLAYIEFFTWSLSAYPAINFGGKGGGIDSIQVDKVSSLFELLHEDLFPSLLLKTGSILLEGRGGGNSTGGLLGTKFCVISFTSISIGSLPELKKKAISSNSLLQLL